MKIINIFDIETKNARFNLTIRAKSNGKGYVGEYSGTTPKVAQVVRPGSQTAMMKEIGAGKLAHEDPEKLIAACRAEIEELDGQIERTIERKV